MTKKAGKPEGRRSINIEADLHQAIDMESARSKQPMYEVMRDAWDCYVREVLRKETGGSHSLTVSLENVGELSVESKREIAEWVKLILRAMSSKDPKAAQLLKSMRTVLEAISVDEANEEEDNPRRNPGGPSERELSSRGLASVGGYREPAAINVGGVQVKAG